MVPLRQGYRGPGARRSGTQRLCSSPLPETAVPEFGLSDGDGAFEVSGLEPGAYTVVVTQRFYDVHTFLMNVTRDEYIEISLVPDYEHPEIY